MQKKTYKEIQEALPNLANEKVETMSDELDRILAIKTLFQSEGGKELITVLRNNCAISLRKAIINAKKGEAHELIAAVLDYSANVDLLATCQDISMEEEVRTQLDEAVKEALPQ